MKRFSPFRSIIIAGATMTMLYAPGMAQSVGEITYTHEKPVTAKAVGTPPKTHTVAKGETLNEIAKRYNTTADDLMAINDLANKNKIYPGQTINIKLEAKSVTPIQGAAARMAPSTAQRTITKEKPVYYAIKKGDDIFSISDTREVTVDQLKAWNPTARFTEGERVIVGKEYSQVTLGGTNTAPPASNKRLSGSFADVANTSAPVVADPLVKPLENPQSFAPKSVAQATRGEEAPATVDPAGRTYTLPNLKPAGSVALNQRYGEVSDTRITDMRFYVHHKTLPIGSKINVMIPGNNGYVQAEVVGRIAAQSTADIGLSPDLMQLVQQAPNNGMVTISYN